MCASFRHAVLSLLVLLFAGPSRPGKAQIDVLSETNRLEWTGDIAARMVDGVDRYLRNKLHESVALRSEYWHRDFSSAAAYEGSTETNRRRLAHILGVRDTRATETEPRLDATVTRRARIGKGNGYEVFAIEWPAFGDVTGRGLMLTPLDGAPSTTVIAVPDCRHLPEQIVGLRPGIDPVSQYARRLAENGCRVVVPLLINRDQHLPGLTHREWLYRSAFEMGRGLIGYEVQKVLAIVDWASRSPGADATIGMFGWGEGGLLTLYAAALDSRIDAACVSGYFAPREMIWNEPLDRNVFGLLQQFGDAELATMIAPRTLIVEASAGPVLSLQGGRGAPARLESPQLPGVQNEFSRAKQLLAAGPSAWHPRLFVSGDGQGPCGLDNTLTAFLRALGHDTPLAANGSPPETMADPPDAQQRHAQQLHELDRHTQMLLRESHKLREQHTMSRFDFSSLAAYQRSAQSVRTFFYDEIIGRVADTPLPPNVRLRRFHQSDQWTAYEVVMDVFPDVFAYGLILIPNDLQPGERRPAVVCQHGLEGRPQHTIGEEGFQYYKAFTARLAERGFITFAPQNLYIFGDRFRTLQRKANPLGKTLFSVITAQHQQIVDWLQSLDFVDANRIGFYGLSYGGKTAMRVPALVTDYCLTICSADFNEWVDKNASTSNPRSYVNSAEYEIFEFDLGNTFNYAEMSALIAPRPFMVERGHFDGVADDWTVAHEYAKVRHLYAARLGIGDRTEIEWFAGPHTINARATFAFLHKHLDWPTPPD